MAVHVVDALEAVEIEEDHRGGLAPGEAAVERGHEGASVAESGQLVAMGEVLEPVLLGDLHGDVADRDLDGRRHAGHDQDVAADLDDADGTAAVDHPDLELVGERRQRRRIGDQDQVVGVDVADQECRGRRRTRPGPAR